MEHEEWKAENEGSDSVSSSFSANRLPISNQIFCSACGAESNRRLARFCRVCGKFLSEDYKPLDAFRAAHRMQGKILSVKSANAPERLFAQNKNSASEIAWAFVVYSLVPYLGILFCPGAAVLGGVGIIVSRRRPYLGGGRKSAYSLVLSFIIFAVQIFLWWLLYFIPEIGKQI